jgi:Ca-activated chloride channel family protein
MAVENRAARHSTPEEAPHMTLASAGAKYFPGNGFWLLGLLSLALAPAAARADGFIYIPLGSPNVDVRIVPPPFPRPVRPHFPLQVTRHRVGIEIDETAARTRVEETFYNPNDAQLEGVYLFPLPPEAAVSSFAMRIGGKEVTGEVLEKGKAREIYEGIVRQARDPGLLEYIDRGLFRASVFPIPARGGVDVTIEYSETLPRDRGLARYRYPLDTGKYSAGDYKDVLIDLRLRSSAAIRSIQCPSHEGAAVVRSGEKEARVTFEAKTLRADRDFILTWNVSEDALAPFVLAHRGAESDGAFLLTVSPRPEPAKTSPTKDIVFVIDTSGSMIGEKIEQVKKALRHGVAGLNAGDRFNIVDFSTEARRFREGLIEATEAEKKLAMAHIDELRARGGTNIEEGLRFALSDLRAPDRLQLVVLLSDGEPTIGVISPAEILQSVKDRNPDRRRIFIFGVGEDLNTKLLDVIAREGRGAVQYVRGGENLEIPLSIFFDKIDSPVLTDITVEFPGGGVSDIFPRPLPDLFRGEQLEVYGRYSGEGQKTVLIRGKLHGEARVFEYSLPFAAGQNAFVPRLWALRKIGYLLEQMRLVGETSEVKEEVIRLSKRYGIITPYTSYLILEEDRIALRNRGTRPTDLLFAASEALGVREVEQAARGSEPAGAAAPALRSYREAKAEADNFAAQSGSDGITVSRRVEALKRGSGGAVDSFLAENVNAAGERVRRMDERVFYLQGSRWIDSALTDRRPADSPDALRIKYLSDEYFRLAASEPGIGKLLAIGPEVTFAWNGRVIAVEL